MTHKILPLLTLAASAFFVRPLHAQVQPKPSIFIDSGYAADGNKVILRQNDTGADSTHPDIRRITIDRYRTGEPARRYTMTYKRHADSDLMPPDPHPALLVYDEVEAFSLDGRYDGDARVVLLANEQRHIFEKKYFGLTGRKVTLPHPELPVPATTTTQKSRP